MIIGGRMRGRKQKTERIGVTTRRGKAAAATAASKRGGGTRGGRTRNDKKKQSESSDVYEFHDDSDENKERPRLILTIKSQSSNTQHSQSAVIKETPSKVVDPPREEFVTPAANTRKSRRIRERDGSRNTVDDTIEDVVRNAAIVTRSAAAAQAQGLTSPRRSTRQNVTKVHPVESRKSPRAGKKKDRRTSETTDDSSEEKSAGKKDEAKTETQTHKEDHKEPEKVQKQQEKERAAPKVESCAPMGLKATVLRRIKGDLSEEPQTLIDPVTGKYTLLTMLEIVFFLFHSPLSIDCPH